MSDEYDGLGGTYLLDPATGRRTLLARTMPAGDAPMQTPLPTQSQVKAAAPEPTKPSTSSTGIEGDEHSETTDLTH